MTCQEAEKMVIPYIHGELTDEELEGFLEHIETCDDCLEELEIYFTVDLGIRQLDSEDTGSYNIKGALENTLEMAKIRINNLRMIKIARYSVNTLCVMGVLLTIALQVRIWWQSGFFR